MDSLTIKKRFDDFMAAFERQERVQVIDWLEVTIREFKSNPFYGN